MRTINIQIDVVYSNAVVNNTPRQSDRPGVFIIHFSSSGTQPKDVGKKLTTAFIGSIMV